MKPDPARLKEIEEVFDRIVELPRTAWAAALKQACGDDADLRSEVESLLAHDGPASARLHLTETLQALAPETTPDPNIHRRIGPYTIQQRIGAGGMGNVYRAVQTEPVQRTVALKLIRRGIDTEETIARFAHERRVLAALNHPNIAQLHDAGTTDEDLPYFVMEYVDGEPITDYCDRRGLVIAHRLRLFQQVCAAVHFAHQNTVIHRDLKPANILVTPAGVPKLLDFGIAKLTAPDPAISASERTEAHSRFLTLEYASPEQVRGEVVTTASDVYSLGVILHELLIGHRPYDLAGLSRDEAEKVICGEQEPMRPSKQARRSVRKLLSGDLDNILLAALRKEPSQRYASAEQLSADITRHLRDEPVWAVPAGRAYRLLKFARRNRAACALIAALVFGLVGSLWGVAGAVRSRDAALAAGRAARDQAERLRRAVYGREMTLAQIDARARLMGDLRARLSAVPHDLREWEWMYLNALADDSLQTWSGHEGEVRALAFSPDGQQVCSGGEDQTIRIWDAHTGECRFVVHPRTGGINSLSFSPDGLRLISGSSDGSIGMWGPQTGSRLSSVRGDDAAVLSVRFSPDGECVAAASENGTIRLWDVTTGRPTWSNTGYEGVFDSLAFSPDGRLLAVGGTNRTVRIWDVKTGALVRSLDRFNERVSSLNFSPDGQLLAIALYSHSLHFYDTRTWTAARRLRTKPTCLVAFSPDGTRIACSGSDEMSLTVWNVDDREREANFRGHENKVLAVAFSPDGKTLVSASRDGTLRVWDGEPVEVFEELAGHEDAVSCLAISPDSRMIVSGSHDRTLRFWDIDLRMRLRRVAAHDAPITGVSLSPDGRCLASGAKDGVVRIWEAGTGFLRRTFIAHAGGTSTLAFMPDSQRLVSGGADAVMRLWNCETGREERAWSGHDGPVLTVACSPAGRWIASGGGDGTVRLWSAGAKAESRILQGHRGAVRCVAFSPDGGSVASAGDDGTVRIRPVAVDGLPRIVSRRPSPILWVAFHPAGRRIVSGGADAAIRLYDIDSGTETLTFRDREGPVRCVLFTPDARMLISCDDKFVRLKDTLGYPERFRVRGLLPDWIAQAGGVVDDLYDRHGDWEKVVEGIRNLPDLSEPVRRRALNQTVARASDCASPEADWDVVLFPWPPADGADPEELAQRWQAASTAPGAVRLKRRRIDFNWDWRAPAEGLKGYHFGMVAKSSLRTTAGRYRFTVISDDGVRLWIDGRTVVDHWRPHEPFTDVAEVDLAEGEHPLRVEYYQTGGYARLRLCMEPVSTATATAATGPR